MKTSHWRVGAILANVAFICLAHPDGGHSGKRQKIEFSGDHLPAKDVKRHGIDVLLMTRAGGRSILPNYATSRDVDVGKTSNTEWYASGSILPNEARRRDIDVGKKSNTGSHASVESVGRHSVVASSGASYGNSAKGRSSVATAMINFNLGGPIHRNGGYRDIKAVWVGSKHDGRGSVIDQNSNGVSKGYNKQENEDGIPQGLNSYSGVNIGGGHGGGFNGVNIAGGNDGIGYTEPESERNSGGYDGGLGDHIEGVHSAGDGNEYNNQVNIGGIVSGHNGYDEVSNSGVVGGGGSNFGDKFKGGSGGGFSGLNVDGDRGFGYSETESEQNSLGYNEGVPSGDNGVGDSNGGVYNVAKVNGAPALVGGGVGGVYLSATSNEGGNGAPVFGGDEVSGGGYSSTQAESGGDISVGGYSDPELDGGNGSGFYTPPVFGSDEVSGGGYSTQAESGGAISTGGDISTGDYIDPELDGSNGSGFYAPPVWGDRSQLGSIIQAESGGDISKGGYSDPELDGGNGSSFYTPPVWGGRSNIGSIIQSGILQAEYSASDKLWRKLR